MAVVAVAADSSRYDSMDTDDNTTNIGGGTAEGVEEDITYQNNLSISRKVTAHGFYTTTSAARNLTAAGRKTWIAKGWLTNYGSLATPGNKAEVRVGSGTADYYNYIFGSSTVEYPAKGGWVIMAIDPSIASHRSGTVGSPALSACDYFAAYADCSTSRSPNLVMDAIDVHHGHYITGGTSTDPDGTFADMLADDEGDVVNGRIGAITSIGDTILALGRLIIGATSSSGTLTSTATEFTSVGESVVFPDHWAAAGFSGLTVDLGIAGTTVKWTRGSFKSEGTSAGEDTRAVLDVVNTTSTLGLIVDLCSFVALASVNLNTKCSFTNCTFTACGQIDTGGTSTLPGSDLSGVSVIGSTATSAVLWNTNHDPVTEFTNMSFVSPGTGHAMEFGSNTPSTIELIGHDYGSDYAATDGSTGNEVVFNNSGKHLTINVTNGATPTIMNGSGASTTVNNPVTLTLTGIDTAARVVVVSDPSGARTVLADGFPNGSGEFAYAYNYTSDTPVDIGIYGIDNEVVEFLDTLTNSSRTFPVPQSSDPFYNNP